MSNDGIPDFPERVACAVREADRLAAELGSEGGSEAEVTSSPEYQELVHLKVILEMETSRTLAEIARINSELERTDLAEKLALVEEER
jgi:hypothetical protein